MSTNLLVIINGLPCTGKSTLAKKLAQDFQLPLLSKDAVKESLFDTLGVKDRDWSKKLGLASIRLHFQMLEELLQSHVSVIVENDYKPEFDNTNFIECIEQYDVAVLQFHLVTEGEVLYKRFQHRSEFGERHPGHVDHLNYNEFKSILLAGRREALDIGGTIIELDTTVFEEVDYDGVHSVVKKAINSIV